MQDNKNLILAVALSAVVLIAAQYFLWGPQQEDARRLAEQRQAQTVETDAGTPATPAPSAGGSVVPTPGSAGTAPGSATPPVAGLMIFR